MDMDLEPATMIDTNQIKVQIPDFRGFRTLYNRRIPDL